MKDCELIMLVDRSGSMSSCRDDMMESMNTIISDRRKEPGKCFVTAVQFDHEYDEIWRSEPLENLTYITAENYKPRGTTSLFDAIGRLINEHQSRIANTKRKVICVIVTDGFENSSKEFTQEQIKDAINATDWDFIYLGTDQEAITEAQKFVPPDHLKGANTDVCRSNSSDDWKNLAQYGTQAVNFCRSE